MAKVYQQNGFWYLDFSDEAGRHRKSLGKVGILPERDARRIEKQAQLQESAGHRMLAPARSPMFSAFADSYLAWHANDYPDSHYRIRQLVEQHLLPYFGTCYLDMIRPKTDGPCAENYKTKRLKVAAPTTVGKELRSLKAMLNKAVEWEELGKNRILGVAEPRSKNSGPPPYYEHHEVAEIYKACVEPWHEHAWRLYVNTGMRRGEGMILKPQWIKLDRVQILSTDEERTKSGKWREVPLNPAARNALEALRPYAGDSGYVLPRVARASLSRGFIKDAARAKVGGSIHWLRHTYATHLVANRVDLKTVKELLGHSTIAVTEKYLHVVDGRFDAAAKAVNL